MAGQVRHLTHGGTDNARAQLDNVPLGAEAESKGDRPLCPGEAWRRERKARAHFVCATSAHGALALPLSAAQLLACVLRRLRPSEGRTAAECPSRAHVLTLRLAR
jgi:hypothetical protein